MYARNFILNIYEGTESCLFIVNFFIFLATWLDVFWLIFQIGFIWKRNWSNELLSPLEQIFLIDIKVFLSVDIFFSEIA